MQPIIAELRRAQHHAQGRAGSGWSRGSVRPACPSLSLSFLLLVFLFFVPETLLSSPSQSRLPVPAAFSWLSLPRYSLLFPLSPSSVHPPSTPLPGFPFPSRIPAQPDLPRRPFSCPALAPVFPCPVFLFAPQPRGSGCRRIKARGPEPGAARSLQESPHGAGGSRRIPPCRSDASPDSAGAAAFPARRRERPPLSAAPCPPSVPLPLAAPGPGQRGWGGTSTLLGAAPPFLLQQNPFLRAWTCGKGLEEALRCCPGQSDSFCAFFRGQEKGVKTRGSDAFWGIPRSPGEGAPLRCRSGTARASHRVGGNTWIRAWVRGASLKGGAEGRIFVPGSSSRTGPCWLPCPRWAESSDLGRMGCQF
ncbi:nascent polypeptide-associated complex subunit alpha, muscle-specific form-like [Melospiza georgiana]|uniref:nascent polypeptide-associated complex subunit alpha, muscle-specific form-like n=1 Tax=Melospiza georgiana TaxID=44398 RepID=UPI0025ABE7C7|nr:nascent polypeptide-associated complex subunit alpha, muscle-specific form-like [Melospiza georgiana]XP_057890741.1 nascent polypeptide-associated complex subunit alpha, muscle-specific form-like [Melospiza georgiana]XP_057890742.1 nascent polypeptide-associated complex subunit alpha, muscle-specific form-like [Melospiza georgiana]